MKSVGTPRNRTSVSVSAVVPKPSPKPRAEQVAGVNPDPMTRRMNKIRLVMDRGK